MEGMDVSNAVGLAQNKEHEINMCKNLIGLIILHVCFYPSTSQMMSSLSVSHSVLENFFSIS